MTRHSNDQNRARPHETGDFLHGVFTPRLFGLRPQVHPLLLNIQPASQSPTPAHRSSASGPPTPHRTTAHSRAIHIVSPQLQSTPMACKANHSLPRAHIAP